MLAIHAVYRTPAELTPRYATADAQTRQALDLVFELWQSFAKAQRDFFRNSVPRATVDEIYGASHYVFISHTDFRHTDHPQCRPIDSRRQYKERVSARLSGPVAAPRASSPGRSRLDGARR